MKNNGLEAKEATKNGISAEKLILGINPKKLTLKRRKFLKKYFECLNATEAARYAYPKAKETSLAAIGSENLSLLKISFDQILALHGLTDDRISKAFTTGLDANKVELGRFEGKITDERVYPDLPTRKTYLELFLKMTGRLNDGININQFIDARRFEGEDPGDYIRRTLSEVPSG